MNEAFKITGAEAILLSLIEENVDTIFGYPGGAIMPIYDKLFGKFDKLKHILVRHEQGAAHAAQAYAQVTGKPGVCFATSGPGATNLITGITNAHLDSIPVVFITAQVPSALLGTDAFQETDMISLSIPVTKWNYQVTNAGEVAEALALAFFYSTSGRPGPVLIDITKDAQNELTKFNYKRIRATRSYIPKPKLKSEDIKAALQYISQAKQPLFLAGHGILLANATQQLDSFINKTKIPVTVTLLGKSAIPEDNPDYVGMLGMHGNYAPNVLTNQADLLIAAGMRFDDRVTGDLSRYAKNARIIHVDIDKSELNKNIKADVAIHADIKEFLEEITRVINFKTDKKWRESFDKLHSVEKDRVINKECFPENGKIRSGEVVNLLSEKTSRDAIIVTDVGQNQMMGARYYQYKNPNSFVTSGGLGTMGFGLPAAVGAQVGRPDKTVILFTGDGGFQMTEQELGTIFQYNLPVKIVILNNNYLGMVRQWQQLFNDKRYAETNMPTPNFPLLAQAYGIEGNLVEKREELSNGLDRMLQHNGPYLLEIKIEKEANVFPMIYPGMAVDEIVLENN
ncbi:MAG TPA: biosynthetic-type acetolactate synthase large subunit [Mariniphaga anaerophila]|uniref:Acetolactate synthase n=1 Tax=Mariniphaga anaerophila TaxID=1484053 RepID=A0A831LNV8_9BACT|nr:biosynthetic-type acetolactate synthase large subunit [Mariniphaga anaerophila]